MRTDYALYVVALICFFIGAYAILSVEEVQLYVYALAVVGIVFVGLGYMARPKTTIVAAPTPAPTPPPETPPPKVEPTPKAEVEEEKKEPVKKTTRRRRRKKKT